MQEETPEEKRPLRSGYTTGACATATSLAAARLLLTGSAAVSSSIDLPKGQRVEFKLEFCQLTDIGASAGVIKDAGDDPDVTHGALISCEVTLTDSPGIEFIAGKGIGTVTRTGLAIAVGEAAVNPVPRKMMTEHLSLLAEEQGYQGGFAVTIHCKEGEKLAQQTMNPRLGILGGISILGTTGIVRPFSCSAYIASIHQAIDVAKANGFQQIAATTGSTSEQSLQQQLSLEEMQLIEMGDFVGAVLKYVKAKPLDSLVIGGGFGKLSKLACGHIDLHSRKSSIDFDYLSRTAKELGADKSTCEIMAKANTSLEALAIAEAANIDLASRVCSDAVKTCEKYLPDNTQISVYAFDKRGQLAASAESE